MKRETTNKSIVYDDDDDYEDGHVNECVHSHEPPMILCIPQNYPAVADCSGYRIVVCAYLHVSQPAKAERRWTGRRHYACDTIGNLRVDDMNAPVGSHVYICGVPATAAEFAGQI